MSHSSRSTEPPRKQGGWNRLYRTASGVLLVLWHELLYFWCAFLALALVIPNVSLGYSLGLLLRYLRSRAHVTWTRLDGCIIHTPWSTSSKSGIMRGSRGGWIRRSDVTSTCRRRHVDRRPSSRRSDVDDTSTPIDVTPPESPRDVSQRPT
jgi:hypothetical protein